MRQRHTILVLIPVLLAIAPGGLAEGDEWTRPYPLYLAGTEPRDGLGKPLVAAVRVLGQTETGHVPIAGATISTWTEEVTPTALRSRKLGEARTDEHGIANVTWTGGEPHHWLVEAPGWGTWRESSSSGETPRADIVLEPGVTKRFRILDPMGAPLIGAEVDLFHGCPHGPTLRAATTDSRGHVTFSNLPLDPYAFEMRIDAPGVRPRGDYWLRGARVGDRDEPPTVVTRSGVAASGRVVDPEGRPRSGIIVRETRTWRGPVTVTDEEGRFRIEGLHRDRPIGFYHPDGRFAYRPAALIDAFVSDVPLRVVLRDDRPRDPAEGEPRFTVDVEVLAHYPAEDSPHDGAPVTLVRLADGLAVRGRTGRIGPGLFSVQIPVGEYRVEAGGGFCGVEAGRATVRVSGPGTRPVRLLLERQPWIWVRGRTPRDGETVLRVPGVEKTPAHAYLPVAGPAVVVLDRSRVLAVGPLADGHREVVIPDEEHVRVRVRVRTESADVPPDEIVVGGGALGALEDLDEDGIWTGEVTTAGPTRLVVSAPGHQTERRELVIPTVPGDLDVGEFRLTRTKDRTIRVADHDGRPIPGVEIEFATPGSFDDAPWAISMEEGMFSLDLGPRPEPWIARAEGWHPLRVELSLASPDEIRFPGGRITLHVRDRAGRPLPAVGYIDAERVAGTDGVLDLRGVPDGAHTVLVGARDHVGEVRRVVLRDGQQRAIDVTLLPSR